MTSKVCRENAIDLPPACHKEKFGYFPWNVTAVLCWNLLSAFISKQQAFYKRMRLYKPTAWKEYKHCRLKQHRKPTISTEPLTVMFRASSTKEVMLWLQEISNKLSRLNWELTHWITAIARSAERLKNFMKNIGIKIINSFEKNQSSNRNILIKI